MCVFYFFWLVDKWQPSSTHPYIYGHFCVPRRPLAHTSSYHQHLLVFVWRVIYHQNPKWRLLSFTNGPKYFLNSHTLIVKLHSGKCTPTNTMVYCWRSKITKQACQPQIKAAKTHSLKLSHIVLVYLFPFHLLLKLIVYETHCCASKTFKL